MQVGRDARGRGCLCKRHLGTRRNDLSPEKRSRRTRIEDFRRSVENMHVCSCASPNHEAQSTSLTTTIYQVRRCGSLLQADSSIIGQDDNKDLQALSNMLGPSHLKDLTTALSICETEPILSRIERLPLMLPLLKTTSSCEKAFTVFT